MQNLAGNKDCDGIIRLELTRADIVQIQVSRAGGEVPSSVQGFINTPYGEIRLRRAWYYWVAEGKIPLEVAEKIYQHPQGKATVRAGGHCGCMEPSTQVDWFDPDGKRLGRKSELEKYKDSKEIYNDLLNSPDYRWVEDREKEGKPFVTMYHIDDQAGLLLFSLMVKKV